VVIQACATSLDSAPGRFVAAGAHAVSATTSESAARMARPDITFASRSRQR
jgi:hypothetical protein